MDTSTQHLVSDWIGWSSRPRLKKGGRQPWSPIFCLLIWTWDWVQVVAVDWLDKGGVWWCWTCEQLGKSCWLLWNWVYIHCWKDMEVFAFDQPLCPEHKELYSWTPVVYQTSLLVLYSLHTYLQIVVIRPHQTSIQYVGHQTMPSLNLSNLTLGVHTSDSTIRENRRTFAACWRMQVSTSKTFILSGCLRVLELEFIPLGSRISGVRVFDEWF